MFSEILMRLALERLDQDDEEIGFKIGGITVTNLSYADDIVLIATSRAGLQRLVSALNDSSKEMGLKINAKKTETVYLNTAETERVELESQPLANSDRFDYLGSTFDTSAQCSNEFDKRLTLGNKRLGELTPLWRQRDISKRLKIRLVQTLVWSRS